MRDFNSSLKLVGGGEGDRCKYPYRLDTYGCGCQHDCSYCYAKSLLDFRKMWDAKNPRVGDMASLRNQLRVPAERAGGQARRNDRLPHAHGAHQQNHLQGHKEAERQEAAVPNRPKSALVADLEYMELYDPELAHFQISITATDNDVSAKYEKASSVQMRVEAYKSLSRAGFDTALRVSPYIPGNIDWGLLEGHKLQVEFLRVNPWIKKWLPMDYSAWTLKEGGYKHLPLKTKLQLMSEIRNFDEVSVCEDVQSHYDYWARNVNANPDDCCNLRRN